MIDFNALFKISYGLYIVSSGDAQNGNGFVSNTVFQVTAEPPQFASCCNKNNFTAEFMDRYDCFSVSVLRQDASSDLIGKFGYKTGKDVEKMAGAKLKFGKTGAPIVLDDAVAYLECKVVQKFDVGTHWMFIGEVVAAELLDETAEPLTYAHYRNVKKGLAPKNAPTYVDKSKLKPAAEKKEGAKYQCAVCGYIHDEAAEGVKFEDLPDDWTCPTCGAEKEDFFKV